MVAGLITYLAGLKHLPTRPPRQERRAETRALTADERRTVALLVGVIAITIFQSLAYYQISDVGMVWIQQKIDLATPFGRIPVPWFNSVDSFSSIVSVAPLFALWRWQDRHGGEPGDLGKIGIGAGICAASALVLAAASAVAGEGRVNALWPLIGFFGMGVAFIYYWPTLLALVSRRAPAGLTGTMLGVTFLSLFVSNTIMGWVGSFYERLGPTTFWCLDAAIAGVGMLLVAALRLPLGSGLRLSTATDPAG
jgi:POT family proton-dependent oligopeptide transporter